MGGWSTPRPGLFPPGKRLCAYCTVQEGRWVSQLVWTARKIPLSAEFEPQTVQPVVSLCTDYAIPAPKISDVCKRVYVSVIWPPQGGLPAGNMHGVMWGMNPISLAFSYLFLEYWFNRIKASWSFSINYIVTTIVVHWWISWIPANTNLVKYTEHQ